MSWHIVARVGPADTYEAALPAGEPRVVLGLERPGDPETVRNDVLSDIRRHLGGVPPSEAIDLLHLALAAYSADLRVPREYGEGRWMRDFTVHLPVVDLDRWSSAGPLIEETLAFLSGDRWELRFRSRRSDESGVAATGLDAVDCVSLFSGGLDSLVGAIDLLAAGSRVALVGHYGAGATGASQGRVLRVLEGVYRNQMVPSTFYVQPSKHKHEGEPSMRSRSLLFLALGVAVAASARTPRRLIVAENGPISLNVPFTESRRGSLSTRTTHPHFIGAVQRILHALGLGVAIEMPYRFRTKGEMLREVRDPATLLAATPQSLSCSHPDAGRYQGRTPGRHCGYCVPCLIRRAATHAAGLQDAPYEVDVVTAPPARDGDTGRDLRAVRMALVRLHGAPAHRYLFDALGSGPLPPEDAVHHAEVYRRGMDELRNLLGVAET